jgi:putative ABC transport system ATP-binding protein
VADGQLVVHLEVVVVAPDPGAAAPSLEARDLYRFYRAGDEETLALRGVSLTVTAGELVAVAGPSGSGKSTLLALLAGLDEPDGGQVRIAGQRMSHRTEAQRTLLRRQFVGVLQQWGNLVEHLDVRDNVTLVQSLRGGNSGPRRSVAELLDQVGLTGRASALPAELSGGELARAGLAVALAGDPRVLIADEPTGELDLTTERRVLSLIREVALDGTAVVVASHSPEVAERADRVLHLADGRWADSDDREVA